MQKTVIIALAAAGAITAGYFLLNGRPSSPVVTPDALETLYNQWKVDYKINVGAAEDGQRFKIFSNNYRKIQSHNQLLGRSYTLGLNAFTHLTQEEFSATHLGLMTPKTSNNTVKLPLKGTVNVDWAPKLNGVKDQQQCGSCWAFSAVGALEGLVNIQTDKKINLSEQELVDCSGEQGNQGCNGGLMDQAFTYVIKVGGLASEKAYPYVGADGDCNTEIKERGGKISSFVDVTVNDPDALKAAVAKQPVSVAIEADTFVFQGYTGGVITDDACGTQLDHGVVAVGVNDEDKVPYFKVRNSWGASWGEKGHVRIGISAGAGTCGIQMAASYPTA